MALTRTEVQNRSALRTSTPQSHYLDLAQPPSRTALPVGATAFADLLAFSLLIGIFALTTVKARFRTAVSAWSSGPLRKDRSCFCECSVSAVPSQSSLFPLAVLCRAVV